MFQPMGPNARRSCTKAWQNASAKHSFLNVAGFPHDSKKSGSAIGSSWNERRMLARNPRGGSFVILMPFWRIVTGKDGLGRLVSHRRKFSSEFSPVMPSQIFSRLGIQLGARWQFCSNTHFPAPTASSISSFALGPWP